MNKTLEYCITASISIILVIVIAVFVMTDRVYRTSAEIVEFKPTIIIDPGHGGEDSGATADNILEKDINLKIALKLKDYFIANGFYVKMTRESDTALINDGSSEYNKHNDLKNRVELFNSSKDNIVISIHQNKFSDSRYFGTQIFYSKNDSNSSKLAENIKSSVVSLMQPENHRECKQSGSEIYVLNNAQFPAVMVECGFLSNSIETQKLIDESYQRQLSYCIFLGFMEYYYTNY